MKDVTATDAARNFSDLLDSVERRRERFTIVRRGKAVARIEPVDGASGREVKALLRDRAPDHVWRGDLDRLRELLDVEPG